jgi:hypothetical protein
VALQKTPVPINFSLGVDTKADPKQVQIGKFLALQNSVFDKAGALTKRNGFPLLTTLPNATQTTLTTLNDNLLATGSNLYTYAHDADLWLNQGTIQPVSLSVKALVRNSANQTQPDMAAAASGLSCLVYVESSTAYYQIIDTATGQQIVQRTAIENTATNPRVFVLHSYFIITFLSSDSGSPHLRYISIPIANPTIPAAAQDISVDVLSTSAGYDGVVANNTLYIGWAASASFVKITTLSSVLNVSAAKSIASSTATRMSLTADESGATPIVWMTWWDTASEDGFTAAYNSILGVILAKTQIITNTVINTLTSKADDGVNVIVYENNNTYNFTPNAQSDYISKASVTQAGSVGSTSVVLRSVGLASKLFTDENTGTNYVIATYGETNQPTYFLIDLDGVIYMRLAYANGGGYVTTQVLPNVSIIDGVMSVPYLIKTFLAAVNKGTALPSGTPSNGIYTQTGINLASFSINSSGQYSSSIANTLHLTGGKLWMYDGVKPVEHGFHIWPENITTTVVGSGGSMTAQQYYYIFCYEWTDNQGNLHRSAPSIPVGALAGVGSNSVTLEVPTLRLTSKTSTNPVRIVGYRWSAAQQTYYQFTSISSPTLNDTTVDNVTITDTAADSSIIGQTLLYTTGGVVENIAAPASSASCLFKNRLWLVDAEDPNLLWYSKQVIAGVPVEMSDLLTLYVAPTSGAQGSTGATTAISAMDDKLIIFKRDAIYYVTGVGPDNTGANNDFSDPVFIQSPVGCSNPKSIVLTPNGIMFQSDKGIWLLGRDLQTSYLGAPVEAYNSYSIQSAKVIPGTNQVRFVLADANLTLMYDYFFDQWGTHTNLGAISSTLYENKDTYLNDSGRVYQEAAGTYLDGSRPVLLSFTTSWISLAGLQGYERFYFMYLLGTYYTPFKLSVQIGYDYNRSASQIVEVTPDNYSPKYGREAVWGSGGPWGGPGNVFEARVFPAQQKCETFQITIQEIYDPSFGVAAGAGLSLSGLNLIVGTKKGYRTQKAGRSFG